MDNIPAIIVHGGAGKIDEHSAKLRLDGVKSALEVGWSILMKGGSAIDAVEYAVRSMEDYPYLNAGKGSALNMVGYVEMDALIMDGKTLKAGAVGAVSKIRNPVSLARIVMEKTKHILLVGEGAERFAVKNGIGLIDPSELMTKEQIERWEKYRDKRDMYMSGDTVGAVAIDKNRNIAVAVSTGGLFMKIPGRVGDTPIVGAGGYADNSYGGASATGLGEAAMTVLLSKTLIDFLANGLGPMEAAKKSIQILEEKTGGKCGVIVLDRFGNVGYYHNTDRLIYAYRTPKNFGFGDRASY